MLSTIRNLVKRFNPLVWYGPCPCLTLYRFGRYKAELCYAPADYEPPEHVHENSDGEFLILWARNRPIYRKTRKELEWSDNLETWVIPSEEYEIGAKDSYVANVPPFRFRTLSVRAGVPHAFRKGDSPMIWICFEKWKRGAQVTSVAEDFVLT